MTTHVVEPKDWDILADTDLGRVLPLLVPCANDVKVLAIFDDTGELAGCWAALKMVHVEGVWVADQHRKRTSIQRRMMAGMGELVSGWRVSSAITASTSKSVTDLILRHGGMKLPASYVFPLGVK